jgi:hypothetical protein
MPVERDLETPIIVKDNQLPGGAATLLRYVLTALGGILVTKGFLPAGSDVNQLVGIGLMVGSAVYGVYKTFSNKKKLVTAAAAAPNSIAKVV